MTTPLDQTRAEFEAHRMSKNGGRRPQTWAVCCGNLLAPLPPNEYHDRYVLREDQAAWEAWQAAIASRAVPEGYVLAPLQPTKAMTEAAHQSARLEHEEEGEGSCGWFLDNPEEVYAAMLAAAPKETS